MEKRNVCIKSGNPNYSFASTATITRWGNSSGIRIPKKFLEQLGLEVNDTVEIGINEEEICIRKCPQKNINLRERLEKFYNCPLDEIEMKITKEVDWGAPKGEEEW